MVKKYYRKPYRVKRKKSILRSRFFWPGVLFLVIIGAIAYFLFPSGIFQIEKIIITGEEKVSKQNIASLVPKENIFLIDIQSIEREILDKFPQIAEAEIRRSLPATLNILVVERSAVATWCEEDNCFVVDAGGVIFEEVLGEIDLIKIGGSRELLGKEKITQILKIQADLENDTGIAAVKAFIASDTRLNIETAEGWEIYFNFKGNLDWQIQELGLVLEKQISPEKRRNLEYIDLRFSRVYYK